MQPVALRDYPLIEPLFVDLKAVEQIAAIKLRRFCERLFGSRGDQRLEGRNIALHERFLEAEEIILFDENLRVG